MIGSEITKPLRLLVVEDSDDDYVILLRELRRGGYAAESERVASPAELSAALASSWDLVTSDWLMPGFGGLQALSMIAERGVDLPCIVISGTPSEEAAVEALRAGALDFLSKDKPGRFVPAVERALREAAERRALRAVERELRMSEARHRTSFEVAPEALLTYDLDRARIIDANPAAVALFGYSLDELKAAPLGVLSPQNQPGGRTSVDAGRDAVARSGREASIVFEWTYLAKNGEMIPTETRHTRLPTDGGNLARVTIIDLRERRRIEELRRHAVELELQNRRIQEANRLKSEFLANMSHELRTPLNAIIGFSELLYDRQVDQSSPQYREFVGDILASGRHLLQLINDVLDLAKVEAGKLDFRPEKLDLTRVIGEVISITRATSGAKRISMACEVDPTLDKFGEIVLDPARLKQVAYNYVSNALKFTPEGGRVVVRALPEGDDSFRIEVQDTGPGIEPRDLGQLFVEFQQLETGAAKRHQGTGLGLALTRRLVEAQGGTVGVRSTPGKGSVFHAVLPRRAHTAETPVALPFSATPRLGPRTVLVVEDDDRDRAVIANALAGAGYQVEIARTGVDALAACRDRLFDAITLDLLLPDMSGLDLLLALRGETRTRKTPVVVASVAAEIGMVAGFAVHDVLRKPVDRDALVAALERAGVRPDRAGGILVVDDDDGALRLMDATLAQLGYTSITRSSGAAGLAAAEELNPVAVVLDLMMPGMDGVEFLARLRRMPQFAATPVLIWTMKDLTAAEQQKLRESAQGIVSKNGTQPATVVEQIQTLLAGGG
jgi:PAS domain S-box-containing protein